MCRIFVFGLLIIGLASPARVANAGEDKVRDSLTGEARSQFDEGTRLFQARRYAEARQAFAQAAKTSGDTRVLFNAAVCDKELGRYARAITTFRESAGPAAAPAFRARVDAAVATLLRYVASVELEVNVADASVWVDDAPVAGGLVMLDPGTHRVEARRTGYTSAATNVTVTAGDSRRLTLSLQPEGGNALLRCEPVVPCEITVDGQRLGRAPVTFTGKPGTYTARALVDGRTWAEESFVLRQGDTIELPLRRIESKPARLRVSTDEPRDMVWIDGSARGRSGAEIELSPGSHHVQVESSDKTYRAVDLVLREAEVRDLRLSGGEAKSSGISPWWFVGGGVLVAGVATTAILLATRSTRYEGSGAGTLNPYVVPASRGGMWP